MIQPGQAASLLELPDLQDAFSNATAEYDYIQKVIEDAIEKEKYEFYEVINFDELLKQCATFLKQLGANDEDPKIMKRIEMLMTRALSMQKSLVQMAAEPAVSQAGTPAAPGSTPGAMMDAQTPPMVAPSPVAPPQNAVPLAPPPMM